VLACVWAATSLGVTYEHDVDGCDLGNLSHARAYAGLARHCEAEGGRRNVVKIISSDERKIETY
jgi:hypothetical protein